MENIIELFHVDIKLLLAQMINFAIVISALYFIALKPLLKTMQERSDKIEKSLRDAEAIEEKMQKANEEYTKIIKEAKNKAAIVMGNANRDSEENKEKMIKKAKEEIGTIINEEKAKMQREKAQVLKEIREEVADLISLSIEKVIEKKFNSNEDMELINKIIKNK